MYTTLTKVRLSSNTTQGDIEIEAIIADVSAYMDNYCGYKLGYDEQEDEPTDLLFDGSGTEDVILGLSVVGYDDVEQNSVIITDDTIAYPLNKPFTTSLGHKTGNFTDTRAGITLVNAKEGRYTVDWMQSGHNLPLDLQIACNALVVNIIETQDGGTTSASGEIKSEKIGDYTVTYQDESVAGGGKKSDEIVAFEVIESYRHKLIV